MSIRIGALWLKTSKDGKKYMSGNIQYPGTELQFAVFKNEEKKEANQPDYFISWSPERKESGSSGYAAQDNGDGVPF